MFYRLNYLKYIITQPIHKRIPFRFGNMGMHFPITTKKYPPNETVILFYSFLCIHEQIAVKR